jgi:hypothetical protein
LLVSLQLWLVTEVSAAPWPFSTYIVRMSQSHITKQYAPKLPYKNYFNVFIFV